MSRADIGKAADRGLWMKKITKYLPSADKPHKGARLLPSPSPPGKRAEG